MEGVGHSPSSQSEFPPPYSERYYPAADSQQFKTDNPPPPYYNENAYTGGHHPQQEPSVRENVAQPQTSVMTTPTNYVRDHYFTLGVIVTVSSLIIGTWYSLLCTIPAIIFSTMARDADAKGNKTTATNHGHIALGLNIGALASWPIFFAVVIIITFYL